MRSATKAGAFLMKAFGTALFLIFAILLAQFNKFISVGLVLTAVVLSTIGVLIGLMVMGQPFGVVMTGIGVIANAGVIVNNNIVLIDTYDRLRREGVAAYEAILETCRERARPVVLTAVTAILGVLPIAFGMNIEFMTREITIGAPATQWWISSLDRDRVRAWFCDRAHAGGDARRPDGDREPRGVARTAPCAPGRATRGAACGGTAGGIRRVACSTRRRSSQNSRHSGPDHRARRRCGAARARARGGRPDGDRGDAAHAGRRIDAVEAITADVPDCVVGVGTVTRAADIAAAVAAGAKFLVSPGTPPELAAALAEASVPVLPGCATVSEAMALAARGFKVLKFFPAEASGGIAWLKSVAAPLPEAKFCPTGGIDGRNVASYLACPNVLAVGGSWVAPKDAIASGDFARITQLAREARPRRAADMSVRRRRAFDWSAAVITVLAVTSATLVYLRDGQARFLAILTDDLAPVRHHAAEGAGRLPDRRVRHAAAAARDHAALGRRGLRASAASCSRPSRARSCRADRSPSIRSPARSSRPAPTRARPAPS